MPVKTLSAAEKEVFERLTKMSKEAGVTDESGARIDEKLAEGVHLPAEGKTNGDAKMEDVTATAEGSSSTTTLKPATFALKMTVTSGTYVRSIVHDIGLAIGSAAHVVKLTRTRQGQFGLTPQDEDDQVTEQAEQGHFIYDENGEDRFDFGERKRGCVPWDVFARAIEEFDEAEKQEAKAAKAKKKEVELDEEEAMNAMTEEEAKPEKWKPKEWERELWARFVVKD